MRVTLVPTCVVDTVAPEVGVAVTRVLRRLGHEVSVPDEVTCCGQPAWNAGFADAAAKVAGQTLDALMQDDPEVVCVPAGSCATMMRVYWPQLFESVGDSPSASRARALAERVKEFSEFLSRESLHGGRYEKKVAYHHSCHMLRELHLEKEPIAALRSLKGCQVANWEDDKRCCGFGGLFSLKQPEISVAMADEKLDSLEESEAEELVGCDASCLLQLEGRVTRRGMRISVRHLAEVLDEAYSRDA